MGVDDGFLGCSMHSSPRCLERKVVRSLDECRGMLGDGWRDVVILRLVFTSNMLDEEDGKICSVSLGGFREVSSRDGRESSGRLGFLFQGRRNLMVW